MNKETYTSALSNGIPEMLDIHRAAEKKYPTNTDSFHRNLLNECRQKQYIADVAEERELQWRFMEWAFNCVIDFLPDNKLSPSAMYRTCKSRRYYTTAELFERFLNSAEHK